LRKRKKKLFNRSPAKEFLRIPIYATLLSSLALIPVILILVAFNIQHSKNTKPIFAMIPVILVQLYLAVKPSLTLMMTVREKRAVDAKKAEERRQQRLSFELMHAFKATNGDQSHTAL